MGVKNPAASVAVSLPTLSTDLRVSDSDITESGKGFLVTNVDTEGLAYISGIRKGDIIYSLARIKIKNTNEFKDVLSDLDVERRTTIGVARNGNKRILSLNLSK